MQPTDILMAERRISTRDRRGPIPIATRDDRVNEGSWSCVRQAGVSVKGLLHSLFPGFIIAK